jgi:transcriptional regulator with XRE-family HTH domain
MRSKLIIPSTEHKNIDGSLLSAEREKTGLSQAAFASECGHSQQYQQQIEAPGFHEIKTAKAEQIFAVLEKYK